MIMPKSATTMVNSHMSEADLAHAILKANGSPLYFKDLLEQVMAIKPVPGKDVGHILAGIHTEINLDGRFVHVGQGVWGLREWMPDRKIRFNQAEEEWDN